MNLIEKELVLTNMQVEDSLEAISQLGELLLKHGYVRESFLAAAIERERDYATGLATPILPVAIPHASSDHVLRSGIAVGILAKPVEFGQMGDPGRKLPVKIVLLLAVQQSDDVAELMSAVVEILRDSTFLRTLVEVQEKDVITRLFQERLSAIPIE